MQDQPGTTLLFVHSSKAGALLLPGAQLTASAAEHSRALARPAHPPCKASNADGPSADPRARASGGQLATEQTPALTLDAVQTGAQEKMLSWPHVSLAFLGLQCKGVSPLQARNETEQPLEGAPKG